MSLLFRVDPSRVREGKAPASIIARGTTFSLPSLWAQVAHPPNSVQNPTALLLLLLCRRGIISLGLRLRCVDQEHLTIASFPLLLHQVVDHGQRGGQARQCQELGLADQGAGAQGG